MSYIKKGDPVRSHLSFDEVKCLSGDLYFLEQVVADFHQVDAVGIDGVSAYRLWDTVFADNQSSADVEDFNGEALGIGDDHLIVVAVNVYIGHVSIFDTIWQLEGGDEGGVAFHSDVSRIICIAVIPTDKYIASVSSCGNLNYWTVVDSNATFHYTHVVVVTQHRNGMLVDSEDGGQADSLNRQDGSWVVSVSVAPADKVVVRFGNSGNDNRWVGWLMASRDINADRSG